MRINNIDEILETIAYEDCFDLNQKFYRLIDGEDFQDLSLNLERDLGYDEEPEELYF
jgi:hypothetical protein